MLLTTTLGCGFHFIIKQRAKIENGEIHWCDETGFRSDNQGLRGYSPKGKTPVLKQSGSRLSLNMISSITNQGKLGFKIYESSMNAELFIEFLRQVIKSSEKKVFMIVDNLRVHHANMVREWVDLNINSIEIFYIPPYSPELNPDEYLNCDVKTNANSKRMPRSKEELRENIQSHMEMLHEKPDRIKSYFENRFIQYAS